MNVPIIISGGGIIGNYISVRLKRHNIESLIIEKSSETQDYSEGIRTLTLNNHSLSLLRQFQNLINLRQTFHNSHCQVGFFHDR